jgi:hypothetical protein
MQRRARATQSHRAGNRRSSWPAAVSFALVSWGFWIRYLNLHRWHPPINTRTRYVDWRT